MSQLQVHARGLLKTELQYKFVLLKLGRRLKAHVYYTLCKGRFKQTTVQTKSHKEAHHLQFTQIINCSCGCWVSGLSADRNPDVHNCFANPQQTVRPAPRALNLKVFRRRDSDCPRVLNRRGSRLTIGARACLYENLNTGTTAAASTLRQERPPSLDTAGSSLIARTGANVNRRVHHRRNPLQVACHSHLPKDLGLRKRPHFRA